MKIISQTSFSSKFSYILLILLFIIFFFPFSLTFAGGGVSANYFYILFPIFIIILKGSLKIPNKNILLVITFFFSIFFISVIYQVDLLKYLDRRLISFVIFMSIFSYLFIDLSDKMISAFKISLVIISIYFAIKSTYLYFTLGGQQLGFNAKAIIGTQRYAFVLLVSFWILIFYQPKLFIAKTFKLLLIFIILSGILLSFSRSSIVSLSFSSIIFFLHKFYFSRNVLKWSSIVTFLKFFIFVTILVLLLLKFIPVTFDFYNARILDWFVDGKIYREVVESDPTSSMGYRSFILKKVLSFVALNPITGSGFLGCWIMFESFSCETHNQYSDVLFRTGIFGFCFYIYMLSIIFNFLRTEHKDLFFGFIAILVFSFFHLTFKLSHGGFILSFLIAMAFKYRINR
tara:strand:- start:7998 stop:9200 length:1203 start_codon:yes stop_codon:yes gene_type:complete